MKIGIFGGSFNPPHRGHAEVIEWIARNSRLPHGPDIDELWIIPTFSHPFAKKNIPFETRFHLCQLMLDDLNLESNAIPIQVSTLERDLEGESTTYRTLKTLHQTYPDREWVLILGSDLEKDFSKWYRSDDLSSLAEFYWIPRKGFPLSSQQKEAAKIQEEVAPDIRSSDLRKQWAHQPLSLDELTQICTPEVAQYIHDHPKEFSLYDLSI